MAVVKSQVIENNDVAESTSSLSEGKKKGWQNEGISQDFQEKKRDTKVTRAKLAARQLCLRKISHLSLLPWDVVESKWVVRNCEL